MCKLSLLLETSVDRHSRTLALGTLACSVYGVLIFSWCVWTVFILWCICVSWTSDKVTRRALWLCKAVAVAQRVCAATWHFNSCNYQDDLESCQSSNSFAVRWPQVLARLCTQLTVTVHLCVTVRLAWVLLTVTHWTHIELDTRVTRHALSTVTHRLLWATMQSM